MFKKEIVMKKWRITEITNYIGTKKETKTYLVEKRFLGFLWWYDPFDDGLYSDGRFKSFDEALKAINDVIERCRTEKVIWEK